MSFRLPDHWVWDSWLADDGENYHLFFLRASRALIDPDKRHHRASIGHAVSPNLEEWTLLPDALTADDTPAWDDLATWTGSVVRGSSIRDAIIGAHTTIEGSALAGALVGDHAVVKHARGRLNVGDYSEVVLDSGA